MAALVHGPIGHLVLRIVNLALSNYARACVIPQNRCTVDWTALVTTLSIKIAVLMNVKVTYVVNVFARLANNLRVAM